MKVLLVLAAITAAVYCSKDPHSIGEFQAHDEATCILFKLDMGGNSHAVVMECSCIDTAGLKKSYTCSYFYSGDFEKCTDEQKVYDQSSNGLRGERQNCSVLDLINI